MHTAARDCRGSGTAGVSRTGALASGRRQGLDALPWGPGEARRRRVLVAAAGSPCHQLDTEPGPPRALGEDLNYRTQADDGH